MVPESRERKRGGRRVACLRVAAVVAVLSLVGAASCKTPTTPNPTPTPSPSYPRGKPDATAFENLALIQELQRATGYQTVVSGVGGGVNQAGRLLAGSNWGYEFFGMVAGSPRLWGWTVDSDGVVRFDGGPKPITVGRPPASVDIAPMLRVDSDRLVALGREYGAQAFVDRYPDAHVSMSCEYSYGRLAWEMRYSTHDPSSPGCWVTIYIDGQTGELLARDLSCLNSLH